MPPSRPRNPDFPAVAHGAIRPGTVLQGTYEVRRLVGAGGMGEVYEVRHRRLSGRYAMKLLLEATAADPDVLARFRQEASITSGLRHPNIVQVVDFNQTNDGVPYLVMEYLDGSPLDVRVPPGARLPVGQAVWLVNQVASALAAAHSHDIVHRDLKPQNIFLVKMAGQHKEMVKVLDFGISKVRSSSAPLTRNSGLLGTPQYMAPEQTGTPADVDGRADQFALAAITYELLTGAPAFSGNTIAELLHSVLHDEPAPLAAHGIQAPARFEEVIRVALSKQPDARFADILDFSRALETEAHLDAGDNFARSEASSIGRRPSLGSAHQPVGAATLIYGGATPPPVSLPARAPKPPREAPERDRSWPEPTDAVAPSTISALDDLQPAMRSRGRVVAVAALVLAVVGVGLVRMLRPPAHPVTAAARAPDPTTPPAMAPPPQRAPPPADAVRIDVVGAPAEVQVFVDGVVEDLPVRLPRGEAVHVLRFEAAGYESREWKVNGRKDRTLTIHLHHRKGTGTVNASPAAPTTAWPDPFTQGSYASQHRQPSPAPAAPSPPPPVTRPAEAPRGQPPARSERVNRGTSNPFDP